MKDAPTTHTFPAAQALQVVELVRRWQITPKELLGELGLSETALEDPQARLSTTAMAALLERARSLTGEPGLGFYLGLQRRLSMYGFLGFAAMNAASLGEALGLAVRFTPVVTTALTLRLCIEGPVCALVIEEHADLGSARDLAMTAFLVGLQQIGSGLTGRSIHVSVDVAMEEPPYYQRFAQLLPKARFGQPLTQIVFAVADLDLPLSTPDRAAMRLAREQCELALASLGTDGSFVERVRGIMAKHEGFRSLEEVAASLHVSARTLKRRLAACETSFSALLNQERHQRALVLLRSSRVSLEDLTRRLGYSTVPNFVRAFRKWTGKTPAAYRVGPQNGVRPASGQPFSTSGLRS